MDLIQSNSFMLLFKTKNKEKLHKYIQSYILGSSTSLSMDRGFCKIFIEIVYSLSDDF